MMRLILAASVAVCLLLGAEAGSAEPTERAAPDVMTAQRLSAIVGQIDEDAQIYGNVIEFSVEGQPVVLVYDEAADRMRLMVPVTEVEALEDGELLRLMQANFESALDARYAVAKGVLWGLFVHPLSTLNEEEFVVAIGQTINVAVTFGDSYNSGVFVFGGGDSSSAERRKLIDRLKNLLRT